MTLLEIRTLARQRADQENSTFVTDAELTSYINASYGELYDLLVSRFDDYYSSQLLFTITGGASSYALPSDFYKIRGLDFQNTTSDWVTIRSFNFAERNSKSRLNNRVAMGMRRIQYRIMGGSIRFLPEGEADGSYRLWYIPRFTKLVNDSDQMGDVLDFEEYVVVDAAIKMMVKEESDPSVLMAIKEQLKQRILAMANDRDAGEPERISDVSQQSELYDVVFPRA